MAYIDKVAGGLPGRVAVKLETFEPLGSVKDRTALALVEEMEMKGVITPGKSTLLEVRACFTYSMDTKTHSNQLPQCMHVSFVKRIASG